MVDSDEPDVSHREGQASADPSDPSSEHGVGECPGPTPQEDAPDTPLGDLVNGDAQDEDEPSAASGRNVAQAVPQDASPTMSSADDEVAMEVEQRGEVLSPDEWGCVRWQVSPQVCSR